LFGVGGSVTGGCRIPGDFFAQGSIGMQISTTEETASTAKVTLNGRLDIAGADVVATPLATLSGSKTGLVIDMAGVSFISSIGIRQLVAAAKALSRRGGRLVLLSPNDIVTEVLQTTGITDLLPIVRSDSEAAAVIASGT
jgi:anti-anti-sigma factor